MYNACKYVQQNLSSETSLIRNHPLLKDHKMTTFMVLLFVKHPSTIFCIYKSLKTGFSVHGNLIPTHPTGFAGYSCVNGQRVSCIHFVCGAQSRTNCLTVLETLFRWKNIETELFILHSSTLKKTFYDDNKHQRKVT